MRQPAIISTNLKIELYIIISQYKNMSTYHKGEKISDYYKIEDELGR